jgi:hypothetical protein
VGQREAVIQGEVAAHNVFAEIAGEDASAVARRQIGQGTGDVAIAIGRADAVARIRGVAVTGWRARLAHEAAELAYLESVGGAGGVIAGLGGLKDSLGHVARG